MSIKVRPVERDDVEEIARLKAESGGSGAVWLARSEWQFFENPFRENSCELGWVLDVGGRQLGGFQMAMPQRFQLFDTIQTIGVSTDTFVAPEYRQASGAFALLMLRYFRGQENNDIALGMSANAASDRIWISMKGGMVPGGDVSWLFPFKPGPLILEWMMRKSWATPVVRGSSCTWLFKASRYFSRLTSSMPRIMSVECTQVAPGDSILQTIWDTHRVAYPITSVRSTGYLLWRYEQIPGDRPTLWLVEERVGSRRGWFALRRVDRGIHHNVVLADLLDAFGPLDSPEFIQSLLACVIARALEMKVDALEVRGLHPAYHEAMDLLGFRRRLLPVNQFVYKWLRGKQNHRLCETVTWHLCRADGDAGLI